MCVIHLYIIISSDTRVNYWVLDGIDIVLRNDLEERSSTSIEICYFLRSRVMDQISWYSVLLTAILTVIAILGHCM